MSRVQFIEVEGGRVLEIVYAGLRTLAELERVAEEASAVMRGEPPGSVLALADLTGVRYTLRAARILSEHAAANAPRIRARALVGLHPVARAVLGEVARLTDRPIKAFDSREEALRWLRSFEESNPPER
jgi:hypothetical protein